MKTLSQSDVKVLKEVLDRHHTWLKRIEGAYLGGDLCQLTDKAIAILDAQEAAQSILNKLDNMELAITQLNNKSQDNFVVMPMEPTERMFAAFIHATMETLKEQVPPGAFEAFKKDYLRMIAVAPQPESAGDARELAQKIKTACLIDGHFLVGDATDLITSFAARIRSEAVEECVAKVKSHINNYEQKVACIDAIRQLGKRGT